MVAKLGKMVTYLERFLPIKSQTISLCGLKRSRDKLNPLYIHYHNAYGSQTWQGGDIERGASLHKVTRLFVHVVLQGHMNN